MSQPRESAKNARQQAAAARAAAVAAETRRQRMVTIIGALVVLLVVGGIIGGAILASRGSDTAGGPTASADPNAPLPKTVQGADSATPYAVPFGTATAGAPLLEIWEDFQCPVCGQLEKANGAAIEQLATDGKVRLVWRPATFLDNNLSNDASARAVSAWGCAIDAGKSREYHNTVFQNQPAKEGDGFTDEQLLQFGKDVKITGAAYDTFAKCYTDRTYLGWARNANDTFIASGVSGTPAGFLNGKELPNATLADPTALAKAVAEAAAASAAPSPSAS